MRLALIALIGTASIAMTSPALASVTLTSGTSGGPLATQIYGQNMTGGTTVYGSTQQGPSAPNDVTFIGNTDIGVSSGFAQVYDADFSNKDSATQNLYSLIVNPDQLFSDMKFAVQLAARGTVNVSYLLGGSSLDATNPANYTFAGSFTGGTNDVKELLSGGTFDSMLLTTTAPIAFFELKQMSFNGVNSAVPEPATWAFMLLGFAGVGGALRRSRKQRGQNGRLLQIA